MHSVKTIADAGLLVCNVLQESMGIFFDGGGTGTLALF